MDPEDRIAYVQWGLDLYGPLLYAIPVPQYCTIAPDDPNYPVRHCFSFVSFSELCLQKPHGFGETEAFKAVFGAGVGNVLGKSQGQWGNKLVGAFVLSAASVRLFDRYHLYTHLHILL